MRYWTEQELTELMSLWKASHVAFAGTTDIRWNRLRYSAKWFAASHPEVSETAAYKKLNDITQAVRA